MAKQTSGRESKTTVTATTIPSRSPAGPNGTNPITERADVELEIAAQSALNEDLILGQDAIGVAARDGWVTLTGEMSWQYRKAHAERIVRALPGVVGVINSILIQHPS